MRINIIKPIFVAEETENEGVIRYLAGDQTISGGVGIQTLGYLLLKHF